VLITGGTAAFSGSGFLPGSTVDVYAFSKGTLLGRGVVKSNGKFSLTLVVPAGLVAGSDTIQLQGFAQGKRVALAIGVEVAKHVTQAIVLAKFKVCSLSLTASMKTQLSNLAAMIKAQGASSVVITGYTFSSGRWAKTLSHTQAVAVANYLRSSLKHLGYTRALPIAIQVGKAATQALSRRATVAVTLGSSR
jgi:outer membrane protein OmpA-like peptidoglycan-associated protein